MAKKPQIENPFTKTEAGQSDQVDNSDLDEGTIRAAGVGIKTGELNALTDIAKSLDISRNALMRFALRWFIKAFRAGKVNPSDFVEIPPPQKKKLRMP